MLQRFKPKKLKGKKKEQREIQKRNEKEERKPDSRLAQTFPEESWFGANFWPRPVYFPPELADLGSFLNFSISTRFGSWIDFLDFLVGTQISITKWISRFCKPISTQNLDFSEVLTFSINLLVWQPISGISSSHCTIRHPDLEDSLILQ